MEYPIPCGNLTKRRKNPSKFVDILTKKLQFDDFFLTILVSRKFENFTVTLSGTKVRITKYEFCLSVLTSPYSHAPSRYSEFESKSTPRAPRHFKRFSTALTTLLKIQRPNRHQTRSANSSERPNLHFVGSAEPMPNRCRTNKKVFFSIKVSK